MERDQEDEQENENLNYDELNLLANDGDARARIEAILSTNEEFKASE